MTTSTHDEFQKALDEFSVRLTTAEKENFKFSSLNDVKTAVWKIQEDQGKKRSMRNLTKIAGFLEAMDQFGKVVEVFLNASDMLCLIWGPMKFLLQTASNFVESFDMLLNAYEQLAENIPLLEQYKSLFRQSPEMTSVLSMIYADLLNFHRYALRAFSQRTWQKIFRAAWKDFNARFSHILGNLRRHKELVESQANVLHMQETSTYIQAAKKARADIETEFESRRRSEQTSQRLDVVNWLSSTDASLDQEVFIEKQREYPGTGMWILNNSEFKAWHDPENPLTPMLWLYGIPGAGKTILTSVIVEECLKLRTSVAYFYCHHQDDQRNTFLAVARSVLLQLLNQNTGLLSYLWEQRVLSFQPSLTSTKTCRDLLNVVLETVGEVRIIIDGLDECSSSERLAILSYFTSVIEKDPSPGKLRGLFVSQDENDIKRLLGSAHQLRLTEGDNKLDIRTYSIKWSRLIKEKFTLSSAEQQELLDTVCERAEGMFLFAKLVMSNLYDQLTKEKLREELRPDVIPRTFKDAYGRIIKRIYENPNDDERREAKKLLSWVTCAKRPLKWHEIQGATSIDTKEEVVNFDDRQLRVHVKDLCGSLIEIRPGDRVELVHGTAKLHLLAEIHVELQNQEHDLAALCLHYLTFECFDEDISEGRMREFLFKGYYAFQDYAAVHWIDHLEAWLRLPRTDDGAVSEFLYGAIEDFFDAYKVDDLAIKDIPEDDRKPCVSIKDSGIYETTILLLAYTRRKRSTDEQISGLGKLGTTLTATRKLLEDSRTAPNVDNDIKQNLTLFYGKNWSKCPRHACYQFHDGFSDPFLCKQHINRHEKPFCCIETGCSRVHIGFATEKELNKHNKNFHPTPESFLWKFPKIKKAPVTHTCTTCSKEFGRASSLRIHEKTHLGERPFACETCDKRFTRKHHLERHETTHTEGSQTPRIEAD